MKAPPFRPSLLSAVASGAAHAEGLLCCAEEQATCPPPARTRLADLDPHFFCSIIGTCLSTHELRRVMSRFFDVDAMSDLDVHHESVRLASEGGEAARALQRALERRHEGALRRFALLRDEAALIERWEHALHSGDIPGAYWALLTHRQATRALRARAFGDVHMLSHLVGAGHRADLRRLAELEAQNSALQERIDRMVERTAGLSSERDRVAGERDEWRVRALAGEAVVAAAAEASRAQPPREDLIVALALEVQRRRAAEVEAKEARRTALRVELERERLGEQAAELARELGLAERQLRDALAPSEASEAPEAGDGTRSPLRARLAGRRVLYVGGRPSSVQAIRRLVALNGGEFERHDGGLEDRKGLLAAAIGACDLVVFPVDCIDHDSALALKRGCQRLDKPFVPLRTASVASFMSGLGAVSEGPGARAGGNGLCLRHA